MEIKCFRYADDARDWLQLKPFAKLGWVDYCSGKGWRVFLPEKLARHYGYGKKSDVLKPVEIIVSSGA